jgi:hypothetical protein
MLPWAAWATAWRSAALKLSASATVWSAGVTTITGSPPSARACRAASVSAGAVLRPAGSSSTAAGSWRISRSCSSVRKRCSALPTTTSGCTARSGPASAARRCAACWNRLESPDSTRNCLGKPARDSGHSRVPLPPAMITGRTGVFSLIAGLGQVECQSENAGRARGKGHEACRRGAAASLADSSGAMPRSGQAIARSGSSQRIAPSEAGA